MKRRFTEEQIIGILREQKAGDQIKEITRRHEISEQGSHRWKAKHEGVVVAAEAGRLLRLASRKGVLSELEPAGL